MIAGLAALCIVSAMLSGCGLSAEESVLVQEEQLQVMIEQADGWGAEIVAQVPPEEVELLSDNVGGSRQVSEYSQQWPRYYYFAQTLVLKGDGPRTPSDVADDIEPWLAEQGWERNTESEFPPRRESFARQYYREGYRLTIEVYTEAPPRAQSINVSIVTPKTDPSRG